MWCYCPFCNNLFWCQRGATPTCPSEECTWRRYGEFIKEAEERRDNLNRLFQRDAENKIGCKCVLHGCSNCRTLFFLVDGQELKCPTCGDKVTGAVFVVS